MNGTKEEILYINGQYTGITLGKSGTRQNGTQYQAYRFKVTVGEGAAAVSHWVSDFEQHKDIELGDAVTVGYVTQPNPKAPDRPFLNMRSIEVMTQQSIDGSKPGVNLLTTPPLKPLGTQATITPTQPEQTMMERLKALDVAITEVDFCYTLQLPNKDAGFNGVTEERAKQLYGVFKK